MTTEKSLSRDTHDHTHGPNRHAVIPTIRRLDADATLSGRGVTIAFLDSGFHRHPDMTEPEDRILAYIDMSGDEPVLLEEDGTDAWQWHGTQTSVVALGNGHLSTGLYRGLASEAKAVLVKVSDRGRIRDASIIRGLEWVLANRERLNIRVVNMSLGGDMDASFATSEVDRAAEALVEAGIVVVVAAGNAGCSDEHAPIPPANSPSVITVGGYDDGNMLAGDRLGAYCSSYGLTIDGLLKPEVIAPAIWVAAPILPDTDAYRRAAALSEIDSTPDALLCDLPDLVWREVGLPPHVCLAESAPIREWVTRELVDAKIVATHYQHVDGTSFAAPIVASLVAQMLEANPAISPVAVKSILISSADRIPGIPVERQGYGMINARRATDLARSEQHSLACSLARPPFCDVGTIVFTYHDDAAASVALACDLNGWNGSKTAFVRYGEGIWRAEIVVPVPGRYRYKFVVNGTRWIDDPSNQMREADAYGGFNSVVIVR